MISEALHNAGNQRRSNEAHLQQLRLIRHLRVHTQVSEPLGRHRGASGGVAFHEVVALLESVGIRAPECRAMAYAHEMSGEMTQYVTISAVLAGQPSLLTADESTTALDVILKTQLVQLLARNGMNTP